MAIRLSAVGDSINRTILRNDHDGPALQGSGPVDFQCAHCEQIVADSVWIDTIYDVIIECGICKKTSFFPTFPTDGVIVGAFVGLPRRAIRITHPMRVQPRVIIRGGMEDSPAPGR